MDTTMLSVVPVVSDSTRGAVTAVIGTFPGIKTPPCCFNRQLVRRRECLVCEVVAIFCAHEQDR